MIIDYVGGANWHIFGSRSCHNDRAHQGSSFMTKIEILGNLRKPRRWRQREGRQQKMYLAEQQQNPSVLILSRFFSRPIQMLNVKFPTFTSSEQGNLDNS